ncbi:MAG TPA: ABC transporter substrate-binding protein [Desulfobacterales bacterium]|nr:ABC transporter substrate-binding protein [Desulfobacterales bacterium]
MSEISNFKKHLLVIVLGVMIGFSPLANAGEITLYSSLEDDEIADILKVAKKDLPGIKINVLRLSTGDLGARILAEKASPKHDIIWGWAATNMINPEIMAMIEPYNAKGSDQIADKFKDPGGKWFAATGYMAAFCVNTDRLQKKGLPMPTSWEDLLNPVYKGELIMPNPNSSGTGYLQIASILQSLGEEKGWEYLEALDPNMGQYIKSGSKPCKLTRSGEYSIGASFAFIAMKSIKEGYPLKMVIPSEGSGFELEASALMASSKNKEDAKKFLDWTLSPAAGELYAKFKAIISVPGVEPAPEAKAAGLPDDVSTVLFDLDFVESAKNRSRILKTWREKLER